ncbi:hypothetical protein Tco_1219747 [Tanacetum coccineum]
MSHLARSIRRIGLDSLECTLPSQSISDIIHNLLLLLYLQIVIVMDTAYGSSQIRRIGNWSNALSCEREPAEREVKLLTLTKCHTVSLNPPILAASGDSGDSIDKLFYEGNDDVLEETVAKDVSEVAAKKTKKKRKRKVVRDVSGSTFPPKRTCPPSPRYVVSLDDSHHSGSCSKVKSFVGSPAADAPVTTVAVTTTVTVDDSAVPPPKVRVVSKNLKFLGILPLLVGPIWMLLHTLEQKDRLEDKCSEQIALLSERDTEIAYLKSLLSLKEAEAVEAIRLRGQISTIEVADVAKGNELRDLKERNFVLEGEKDVLFEKVKTLESATALKETELSSLAA